MNNAQPLLVMEREWPWGLAMLEDPDAADLLPEKLGPEGVAACRTAVAVGILHEVEGAARAEVWLVPAPGGLTCLFDDEFTTDSGDLALSDAGREQVVTATVGPGPRRLRVLVDDAAFPEHVIFELSRQ